MQHALKKELEKTCSVKERLTWIFIIILTMNTANKQKATRGFNNTTRHNLTQA